MTSQQTSETADGRPLAFRLLHPGRRFSIAQNYTDPDGLKSK